MEQAESPSKLEESTEQSEKNVDSVSTAPFAIGNSDKENECTDSLSPAVHPLRLETGTGGKAAGMQPVAQLCHALLRQWPVLQQETKHRLRSQLRVHSRPSTDNVVTIELSDEEDEVLQQSNTKTRVVDDAAETLGDTVQKDDGEPKSAKDLVTEENNVVTLALSTNELEMDVRDENLCEDMTTDNVLEQEADDVNPSRNGDDEMPTCVVKERNIVMEDKIQAGGGNNQNLVQPSISEDVMPIVDIPEQEPGYKDLSERVVNENPKSTVHPIREFNVHTLHLSEDKLEAEVRRDRSKLLHGNQSKIRLLNNDVSEQKNHKMNPRKHNLKLHNADHLIKKKKISKKRQLIRTKKQLVVRNGNISTSRDQVETTVVRTRNDSVQPNHSKDMTVYDNKTDQELQTFRKDYDVRKSISVKSNKGFVENSKNVSKNNNDKTTSNVYEDLNESFRLFSSPKPTVIGDYLIHEDDPDLETNILGNYVNKDNARPEVGIIGDKNTLSPESNILKELEEIDVSNVEAIIDFDSDDENATINNGISGEKNKNSSNRVIRTYSAFRRKTTQGDYKTTNTETHDNRENSLTVNVNNVIKTYDRIKKRKQRKSCESKHEISKQDSAAVTSKNASSKSNENNATIQETGGDNVIRCIKNHYYPPLYKKRRKRQQNESSKIDPVLREHNYADMNRRSSCSSAGAGTDNAEVEVAVDATDPKLLMRPVVVIKKLKDQIWDEVSLRYPSRSPTPIYDSTSQPRSPEARHNSPSPLLTPRSSPYAFTLDSSTPAPESVKRKRARKMLLNEDRNERSRLSKKVELPDIEEVRRHNRNMLTAQVTPTTQRQGGLANTESCDHNKSPNTSRSPAALAGCSRCASPAGAADGRLRRGAASRARSFITTMAKKRKYILSKVKHPLKYKPVFSNVKPYRRKRRRRRPRFASPPDDVSSNGNENRPTRDFIILENEEAIRSNNPVPQSQTITSNSNDTPSILNEGLPTHNLATDHKEQQTPYIDSSNSVAGFKSAPSNGASSTPIEGVPTLSLSTAQKEQDTARSFNPLAHFNSAQLLQSSNDAPAALIEDYSTQQLTTVQKEQELTHSFDPVAVFETVATNAAPSVLTEGIPKQNTATVQREQKTTRHSNVVTQFESSNALIKCVSTQNLSKSRKEQGCPRPRATFSIPMQGVIAIQKERKKSSVNPLKIGVKPHRKRKQRLHLRSKSPDDASSVLDESEPMRNLIISENNHDTCSLKPASSNAVPVLDENASMRELATTQSNQETNATVPSNTAPSISNEVLPTQGLTIISFPNTCVYGYIAPYSSTARDPTVLNKSVQTRDVITRLNKRATRIASVPSSPFLIQNKYDTCKRVTLPLPTASLNERRNSVDSMLYASKPLTEKVKACEELKQQKQSSKCGFKPLLFRKGSIPKKTLPKRDFASLHEQGTTKFSNAKRKEVKCLGIAKVTGSSDNMLANNGTTLISSTLPISTQTNLENQNNSIESVSEIASNNSVTNVAELNQLLSSPEVVDASQAECDPVIVNVQSLAPSQEMANERNLHTPAPESTVQVLDDTNKPSLPVITLKHAKPICFSYLTNPLRDIHDFTSASKSPKEVTHQLPKIINVSSYKHKQVKIQSTNDRENCHNPAAILKWTIPSSEQVTRPMTIHLPKVIRESDVQSSQQIERSVGSLGSEPIQPRALPIITLKRAQPVYASYHSPNEMEVLISNPQEGDQEKMYLPRVGDVTGDLHVMQPDDQMGLHLVVSQEEVYNDSLNISHREY